MKYELISNFHGKQMEVLLQAVQPTPAIDLNGREEVLANKEAWQRWYGHKSNKEAFIEAEENSKGIDWAEFDKQDQIIFSSNE